MEYAILGQHDLWTSLFTYQNSLGSHPEMEESQFMEVLREKLREASEREGQVAVAEKTGISQGDLSKFVRGKKQGFNASTFLRTLDALQAKVLFPEDIKPVACNLDDFVMVPKVKARLGAGSSLIVDGDVKGLYAFRQDFMERLHVINWRSLVLFDVMGDSMDPEIKNGDSVLVDTSDREIIGGLIYAIRVEDEIQVKRLNKVPGEIVVESVNKDVAPFRIPASKIEDGGFGVIGRVRWSGRVY